MKCSQALLPILFQLLLLQFVEKGTALDFKYHNHEKVEQLMRSWTERFPNLTRMYSIGQSIRGQDLWVIAIGKHAAHPAVLIPNVNYLANMHGNEVVGRELLLHLAEHYLLQYGVNETLTKFLDTTVVHLMPTMNPDGFAKSRPGLCSGVVGRSNERGVDLNRNFPDDFNKNFALEQPETTLVRKWVHSIMFVLSANLHGGALLVNYPFDSFPGDLRTRYSISPDDDVFQHLSLIYSRTHPTMHKGSSCGDVFENGITNGAMWYPVIGGLQDYMYRRANGYQILIEMSCCKYPRATQLESFWKRNKDALINFLLSVHMGVKGLVLEQQPKNESTPVPLENATVLVQGRESVVFRTSRYGEYYKLLLPGDYILLVSHPDYESAKVPFKVSSTGITRLDIELVRSGSSTGRSSSTDKFNATLAVQSNAKAIHSLPAGGDGNDSSGSSQTFRTFLSGYLLLLCVISNGPHICNSDVL